MAVRPTTLGLENLESRLNLSSLVGTAVVDSFTATVRSQERATLRTHSRLISLNSENGFMRVAGATTPLTSLPLTATAGTSPVPTISLSANTQVITVSWTNNALNATGFRVERSTDGTNFTSLATVSASRTSYTDTKVQDGINYTYRVTAFNNNNSAVSDTGNIALLPPPAPGAASGLANTKSTLNSVTLAWQDSATDETGFNIYRSTDGTNFSLVTTLKPTARTFTDTGLDAATSYDYEISAFNFGGETFAGGSRTATTTTPAALAPINLAASNITSTTASLSWTDSSANLSGFRVYRSTNGKTFTLVGNVDAGTTSYTDTGLSALSKYTYKVSAWNASSNTYSKTIVASTLAAAPNAPSNPAFTNVTTTSLTLSWTPTSTNQTGFKIYRSNDGTNFTLVGTTAANIDSFNDQNLSAGISYWYEVSAYNAGGSTASATVSTTTLSDNTTNQSAQSPATPANLSFANVSSSSLTLNWTEDSTAATGIHIYRSTNGGSYTLVGTLAATATTWNDSSLTANTQYSYEVAAFNTSTEVTSTPASTSTLAAIPNTPSSPTFSGVTTSAVTLNWTEANASAATGIHIYRSTNGGSYTLVGTLAATATTWSDSALAIGTQYSYEVAAYNTAGEAKSAAASISTLSVLPNTPSTPTFSAVTSSAVTLSWQDTGTFTGYHVYRSTDGTNYTLVGSLSSTTNSWTDTSVGANSAYYYKVGAYNTAGETTSAAAFVSTLAAAPNAPASLTLSNVTTTAISLNWTDPGTETGIHIYRSTDGINYTLAGSAGAGTTSWSDSNLSSTTTYYYEIGAYNTSGETKSLAAHATTLTPATSTNPVTFSTQNLTSFTELDITGTTGNDSIVVSQSNGILNIVANGQTYNYTNTYGDIKIFGVNGNDTITVNSSVNIATLIYGGNGSDTIKNLTTGKATIVTIGSGVNTVTGNGINTAYWVNTGDTVNATAAEIALGGVNRVNNFYQPFTTNTSAANYIPRTLNGQNLPDPTDSGAEIRLTNSSLWGTGPSMNDINQTAIADCYFLAPLASLAFSEPQKLMNMAVDLGDGTYAFRFIRNGVTSYVRVDGDLSAGGWDYGLANATPGADGNEWGSLFEKAYAFFRTGANTYASLNYGFQGSSYSDLGFTSSSIVPGSTSASTAMNLINSNLAANHAIVASTNTAIGNGVPLVSSHVYTIIGTFTNSSGTVMVQLRNPWGVDGFNDDSNPNDGLVTISYATFAANFNMLNYTNA